MCIMTNPEDLYVKRYTTKVLCAAAGCEAVTFRAWRRRNSLFPETMDGRKNWNRFSIIDVLKVRLIVELTEHGLAAADAIWFAEEGATLIGMDIEGILSGEIEDSIVGFTHNSFGNAEDRVYDINIGAVTAKELPVPRVTFVRLGEGGEPLIDIMRKCRGPVTLLRLRSIVQRVVEQIRLFDPGDEMVAELAHGNWLEAETNEEEESATAAQRKVESSNADDPSVVVTSEDEPTS